MCRRAASQLAPSRAASPAGSASLLVSLARAGAALGDLTEPGFACYPATEPEPPSSSSSSSSSSSPPPILIDPLSRVAAGCDCSSSAKSRSMRRNTSDWEVSGISMPTSSAGAPPASDPATEAASMGVYALAALLSVSAALSRPGEIGVVGLTTEWNKSPLTPSEAECTGGDTLPVARACNAPASELSAHDCSSASRSTPSTSRARIASSGPCMRARARPSGTATPAPGTAVPIPTPTNPAWIEGIAR